MKYWNIFVCGGCSHQIIIVMLWRKKFVRNPHGNLYYLKWKRGNNEWIWILVRLTFIHLNSNRKGIEILVHTKGAKTTRIIKRIMEEKSLKSLYKRRLGREGKWWIYYTTQPMTRKVVVIYTPTIAHQ